MRILVTALTFEPAVDGVATVVGRHVRGFVAAGHKVTVATGFDPRRGGGDGCAGNVSVEQFKVTGSANRLVGYSGEVERYKDFIKNAKTDVVFHHAWQAWTTDLVMDLSVPRGAKRVLVSHGVSANSRYGWPKAIPYWLGWRQYVKKSIPRYLQTADKIVLLSRTSDSDRFYDAMLAKKLKIQHIAIIPNGADIPLHNTGERFRNENNIGAGLMLLSVGQFNWMKNERNIAKAVLKSGIRDATLVLLGPKKNEYVQSIQRLWHRHDTSLRGLRLVVREYAGREQVASAYDAADIFLSASRTECQPLVLLDAMASGTPFISTNVGCVREFPGGVVVRSTSQMARVLSDLCCETARRKRLGVEGVKAVSSTYNWDCIAKAYEQLLRELHG